MCQTRESSVRLQPASSCVGGVLRARVEGGSGVWRGSVHRVDHGLKHRQTRRRQAYTGADHHTVISPGLELPLHVGSGCFIGPNEARIKTELTKLGPILDVEVVREPEGSRTEGSVALAN